MLSDLEANMKARSIMAQAYAEQAERKERMERRCKAIGVFAMLLIWGVIGYVVLGTGYDLLK